MTIQDDAGTAITPQYTITISPPAIPLTIAPTTLPNATAQANYLVQLSASGGVSGYTFSATGLPTGLSVAGTQIVGQCTASSSSVVVTVTDSVSEMASTAQLSVTCNPLPSITTASPITSGVAGSAYSATLQTTGGTAPVAFSLSGVNNTLPLGFQLSAAGVLTGTPPASNSPVTSGFNAIVTDTWGATTNKTFSVTFYPVLSITTVSLPNGAAGTAYQNGSIVPAGGTGANTYGFSAINLPTGYTINSTTGVIGGTTSQTGAFTPTFTVTDQDAQIASKQINLVVSAGSGITILSPTALPNGSTTQVYNYQLAWSGGVGATTISSSALPSWLSLNASTGVLSGTPPAGGIYTFPITVTDSQVPTPNTASQTETIIVNPPTITSPATLPTAYTNNNYSVNLTASGGTPGYSWTSPNLPFWLNLSTAGALTGNPPSFATTSSFNVTVTDSLGAFTTGTLTVPVAPGPTFTNSMLAVGTLNIPYPLNQSLVVTGGVGSYTFSANNLPTGLALNTSTGAITGTPTQSGTYPTSFTVTDSGNNTASVAFSMYVMAPDTSTRDWAQMLPATVPPSRYGAAMFYDSDSATTILFGGSGSTGNLLSDTYSWNGTNWTLLQNAGTPGARTGAAVAYDPVHQQAILFGGANSGNVLGDTWIFNTSTQTWTAGPISTVPARSDAMMFWDGQQIVLFGGAAGGSDQNDTWTWNGAQWTQFNGATPPARQDANVAYSPTSGQVVMFGGSLIGNPNVYNDTWVWTASPMGWSNPATQPAPPQVRSNAGLAYSPSLNQIILFGGTSPVAEGDVSDTWAWSGTVWNQIVPTYNPGNRDSFTMVTDTARGVVVLFGGNSLFGAANDTWVFGGPVPVSLILPGGTVGTLYNSTVSLVDGVNPYLFVLNGTLPPGMTFNAATQTFGGTPTQTGTFSIPLIIQDDAGSSITPQFSVTISPTPAALTLSPTTLPNATAQTNYLVQLSATGGIPGYTFSATGLPAGLSVVGTQIVGQCTASSSNVIVTVTDSASTTNSTAQLTVTCNPLPSITTASPLTSGVAGSPYSATLQVSGGTAPAFSLSGINNTLPLGFQLSAAGVLTGTPPASNASLTSTFTAVVADKWGATTNKTFSVTFYPVLSITTAALPNGTAGTAYPNVQLVVTGGTGPNTYHYTRRLAYRLTYRLAIPSTAPPA